MLLRFLRVNLLVFFYASSVLAHMPSSDLEQDYHGFNESSVMFYPQLVFGGAVNLPENDPQGWYRIVYGCCTWDGNSQNAQCADHLATYSHDVLLNNSQICSSVEPFVGFQTYSYWRAYDQKTVTCKNFVYKTFQPEPYGGLVCDPYIAEDGTNRYSCKFNRYAAFFVDEGGGNGYVEDRYIDSYIPDVIDIERYISTPWYEDPYSSYYKELWEYYRPWQADFSAFEYIQAISTGIFYITTPYTCGSFTGRYGAGIYPYILLPSCGGVDNWMFSFQIKNKLGKLVDREWPVCSTTDWQLVINHHNEIPNDVLWTRDNVCNVTFSKDFIQGFLDILEPGTSLMLVGFGDQAVNGSYEFIQSDPPCGGMAGTGLGSTGSETGTTKKGLGSVGKGLGGYEKIYR